MKLRSQDRPSLEYYAKLAGAIERQVFDEMSKPAHERDRAMIDECLETLDYIHATARAVEQEAELKRVRPTARGHRRAAFIATIVIATLLSAAGIAQGMGIDLKSLIVWDGNGLSINFGPNISQNTPPAFTPDKRQDSYETPVPHEEELDDAYELKNFSSYEQACAAVFGFEPPMPAYLPCEMRLANVSGYTGNLLLSYESAAGEMDISVKYTGAYSDNYVAGIQYPDALAHESLDIEGTEYFITLRPGGGIVVDWISGALVYHISSEGLSKDAVMKTINSF